MKILANVHYGMSFVYERLRESGHDLVILDDEVLIADVVDIYEKERPDVFFWDPGAPIPERFSMVQEVLRQLKYPPTVLFNVMPSEWTSYCTEYLPHAQVVAMRNENYDNALAAAIAAKAA